MKKLRPLIALTLAIAILAMSVAHADHGHETGTVEHDCIVCQLDAHKDGSIQSAYIFACEGSVSHTAISLTSRSEFSRYTAYSPRAPPYSS